MTKLRHSLCKYRHFSHEIENVEARKCVSARESIKITQFNSEKNRKFYTLSPRSAAFLCHSAVGSVDDQKQVTYSECTVQGEHIGSRNRMGAGGGGVKFSCQQQEQQQQEQQQPLLLRPDCYSPLRSILLCLPLPRRLVPSHRRMDKGSSSVGREPSG